LVFITIFKDLTIFKFCI